MSGTQHLLFLGLLLPLVLVAGQTDTSSTLMSTTPPPSTAMDTSNTANTMARSTVSTPNGGTVTTTPTQSITSTSGGSDSSTSQSHTSSSEWMTSSSTLSATSTSGGSSSHTALTSIPEGSNTMSSSPTMSSSLSTSAMNYGMGVMSNASSMNMTQLYCPVFSCSHSECYWMYNSQNATKCVNASFCQLMRFEGMLHNASCSPSCAESCNGTSQVNCSMRCCNFTGCLNRTFAYMMQTTTMATTTKSTAQSTSMMTSTTADKGNKCLKGTCSGDKCYTSFTMLETCSSTQPHCQLKQSTTATWTAGCANCTSETTCKASTQTSCVQECCTATMTSCLFLNGTSNIYSQSSATRGPHFHTSLIVFLLCLLSIPLLM